MSRQLLDAGRFRQAESALRQYLTSNDLSAEAHAMLAYALLRQNKAQESLKEYTRSAALATPSAQMLESVGQDYVLLDDFADADKWTLRAVQMDPTDAEAWYSLGRIRYTDQRFGDAASCFKKVLELSPRSIKAENNLGLAYQGMNRTNAALEAFRQAVAWQRAGPAAGRSEQPLLNLATVLVQRGDLTGAEPLLQEAVQIAPRDWHIHEQLGQLDQRRPDYAAAAHEFDIACTLEPQDSSLHFLLGQAYRHLGRAADARAQFAIASRLEMAAATPKTP
jgi:Flp pilus assembly protein TadD